MLQIAEKFAVLEISNNVLYCMVIDSTKYMYIYIHEINLTIRELMIRRIIPIGSGEY